MLRTHPGSCVRLRRVRIITSTVMSAAIHQMSGGHPFRISSVSTAIAVVPAAILVMSLILDWLIVRLIMACISARAVGVCLGRCLGVSDAPAAERIE